MASPAENDAAGLLLKYIPPSERKAAIINVAAQLTPSSTFNNVGILASLLQMQPESTAIQTLVDNLSTRITNGQAQTVSSLCETYPDLREQVMCDSISRIERAAALVQHDRKWSVVPMVASSATGVLDVNDSPADLDEHVKATFAEAALHLASIGANLSHCIEGANGLALFRSCLILVGALDIKLALEAQRVLSRIISESVILAPSEQYSIWLRIQELLDAGDKQYQFIGSTLWLRLASSSTLIDKSILKDPRYWQLLIQGLQHGDSERRKSTLQILRASVDIAAGTPSLTSYIVAEDQRGIGAYMTGLPPTITT
jgi:tRNA guanosine-2'-O-methyltransferase